MIVEVIQNYYDVKAGGVLRERGALLHYEDEKRAKELICKGVVREREMTTISTPEETIDNDRGKTK